MKIAIATLAITLACAAPALALDAPAGIAVDSAGNAYVTNAGAAGYVAVYNSQMTLVRSLGGLATPTSVAVDSQGRVFVGDLTLNKVFVYAAGQTMPGGAITQYVNQPVHVRIGSYDEIWIENSDGQIHMFDLFGNFLNGQNSWGSINSFALTGTTVSFVGLLPNGLTMLLENALTTLTGRSNNINRIAVPFVPFDIAYDPTTAMTWLLDRTKTRFTTVTYTAGGPVPSDPGLTLASPPYQFALDVARSRVYVVEPGRNQVEVFNYKTHAKLGALL